jgi:hypothetical protein
MSSTKHIHGEHGAPDTGAHRDHRPYWTRAHRDWRFWIALILMLAAMGIYIISDNLAFLPR